LNTFRYILFVGLVFLLATCGKKAKENNAITKGCNLDQQKFDKAEVFEPLAKGLSENNVPGRVSLLQYAPKRKSQGSKGSCTAWATCYAAGTILWAQALNDDPNNIAFSPDFIYNQMTRGNCTGTNIGEAIQKICDEGLLGLAEFPYSDADCDRYPNSSQKEKAEQFKLKGFNRLTMKHDDYKIDMDAIKQNLSQGAPVVIGMYVGGSFYKTNQFWDPTQEDYDNLESSTNGHIVDDGGNGSFGGHAMCVVGYDDNLEGGSFQIMNSWGDDWGEDGVFWMKYQHFEHFVNKFYGEAYGLFPLVKKKKSESDPDFKASIGLLLNKEKSYIPFSHIGGNSFETTESVPVNTKFKIAVRNDIECYTYVVGQETDGSSYVLFPYTEKHSAYCGITGTRLFPKDYSLQLDNLGTKDIMAVIFSKNEIDFKSLNDKINQSSASTYEDKIKDALGNDLIENVKFNDGKQISFSSLSKGKNAVLICFEIHK